MAHKSVLIFLFLVVSVTCSNFGFDDDFFDDEIDENGDKRTLKDEQQSKSEDETIFVSESTNKLKDGRESIIKESVKWMKDPKSGKWEKKRTSRHFMRLKNGTVVEMEDDGSGASGDTKEDGKMTKVGCIDESDCKVEQFCDRLSYACKDCLKVNQTCHKHRQCCKGSMCRDGKCESITGREGDPCENDKDCKKNHCCAYDDGKEVCKPYLTEGETCGDHVMSRFPSFFASRFIEGGKKTNCPCLKGLICKNKRSFLLYNTQKCVREKRKASKKSKKHRNLKKKARHEKHEMKEIGEGQDEMNLLPDEMMMMNDNNDNDYDEMIDNETREIDDHDDVDDNNDDVEEYQGQLSKRSLEDEEFEDEESENVFGKIPKLLTGFLKHLLNSFE